MEYALIFLLFTLYLTRIHLYTSSVTNDQNNVFDKYSEGITISSLPNYVVANMSNLKAIKHSTIRQKAPLNNFPLTEQDRIDLKILETKFDKEKDCVGLAAPQIGISKRFIVFKLDKEDGSPQSFPKSIWINPTYENVNERTELAYEQCFSVAGVTGPVKRFKNIRYKATDVNGSLIEGNAKGFAARVIQHEIDHLDGILFIDLVPKDKIITVKQFKQLLKKYEKEEERKYKKKEAS